MTAALRTRIAVIDDVLDDHVMVLRNDVVAYRNHVYRIVNLCDALGGEREPEKIAIAAVFHDLGIWTDRTFDYIEPSVRLAREYLVAHQREQWIVEVEAAIANHHKITRSSGAPDSMVEIFRKADWIDVTHGLRAFGVPRAFVARLFSTWQTPASTGGC